MKKIKFTKMQSLGNDFIIIDNLKFQNFKPTKKDIIKLCDRSYGIGCDQILMLNKSRKKEVAFIYQIFNKDGSESGQCGNGGKCVARYFFENYKSNKDSVIVETITRNIKLTNLGNNSFMVDMGKPNFKLKDFRSEKKFFNYKNNKYFFHVLELGNPHAIFFVKKLDKLNIWDFSNKFLKKDFFKKGVNISLVERISDCGWKANIYERGSGITKSCGSAACAIAVCSKSLEGSYKISNYVHMQGGKALVKWKGDVNDSVFLVGKAEYTFNGEYIL